MGIDIVDLTPYISGKKKMMKNCDHKGCKEKQDITKEFIECETQNNKRRETLGDKFNPGSDELVLFLMGWYCKEHQFDKCWVCQHCYQAQFIDYWDLVIHELICKHKKDIPEGMNWYNWFWGVNWKEVHDKDYGITET